MNILEQLESASGWKFNKLCLEDMHIYSNYIKNSSIPINEWSTSFPYLWASASYLTILWSIIDNTLVTFCYSNNNKLKLQCIPFGEGNADHLSNVLYKSLSFCDAWNYPSVSYTKVSILNEAQLNFLQQSALFNQYFTCSYHRTRERNVLERHYSVKKLMSLSGKELAYVRGALNSLYRNFPSIVIRHYTPADYNQLLALYKHWLQAADEKYFHISDTIEYEQILKHYKQLNQIVLVAELDGQILGMISGGALPNGQAWICFRKTLNDRRGLTQALVIKFAQEIHTLYPQIELLNDGSDDGQKGIIFVKEKFRPVLSFTLHSLYRKSVRSHNE